MSYYATVFGNANVHLATAGPPSMPRNLELSLMHALTLKYRARANHLYSL